MIHPDSKIHENKIIRHYQDNQKFVDLSVDQTIALGLNAWRGWLCAAAQESLYIDYDGFIFVANCRTSGPIGSIYDGFKLPKDWITCPHQYCACGADIMIPKVKKSEDKVFLSNLDMKPYDKEVVNRIEKHDREVRAVEVAFRDNRKQVFWDLHRRCNYSCSYCWPEVHNNYEEVKPYELLLKTTQSIIQQFGDTKGLRFLFGGGEPTIIPQFIEWMKYIEESGSTSVVTTNGSRSPEFFKELCRYSHLNISIHFEFANLDRIISNIEAIVEEKLSNPRALGIEIKIMCPPGRVDDAIALKRRLFQIPKFEELVNWSVVPIRSIENNQVLVNYENSEFDRLKKEINL